MSTAAPPVEIKLNFRQHWHHFRYWKQLFYNGVVSCPFHTACVIYDIGKASTRCFKRTGEQYAATLETL